MKAKFCNNLDDYKNTPTVIQLQTHAEIRCDNFTYIKEIKLNNP